MSSIFDSLAARFGYIKAPAPRPPAWLRATAEAERFSLPDGTDAEAQGTMYERLSWLQVAISTVATSAAIVPLHVLALDGETRNEVVDHPLEQRLRAPNPQESRYEFMVAHYATWRITGNSYWYLSRPSADVPPAEIYTLQSHRVTPVPDGRMGLRGYTYDPGHGPLLTLEPWEVAHFKSFSPSSRYVGLSPMQALMTGAHADLAAQQFAARFYGRDNAKVAGILAYADAVDDVTWEQMRIDARREHGDGSSRVMRIRNVGAGGVQWIATQLTHQEMQYLEQRQFTKEEIFALYAPGLASALAINSNEANSKTGDAVFTARAVWPLLIATAEKITQVLLPAYGDALVCEPEDVRHKDRDLEIREQQAAGVVMTIDELREKFHKLDPLGDERGGLLPAEIGKGLTDARAVEEKPAAPMKPPPLSTPDSEPAPAPLDHDHEPDDDALPAEKRLELEQWRRKALKRGPGAAFVPLALTDDDAATVRALLGGGDVAGAFDAAPFAVAATKRGALTDAEQRLYDALVAALSRSGSATARRILAGDAVDLADLDAALRNELTTALTEHALSEMERVSQIVGVAFDPAQQAVAAMAWSSERVAHLTTRLSATTAQIVEQSLARFRATPGMTREQLETLLRPAFGARRAEAIAITSVTDAASAATSQYQQYLAGEGLQFTRVWDTANDGLKVCPICRPLNGQPESVWAERFPSGPPAHARCRCAVALRFVEAPV